MGNEKLLKIKQYLDYLEEEFNVQNDTEVPIDSNASICDMDEILLSFPDDSDYISFEVEEFLDYMSDIDTLKDVDESTVRTKHIRQSVLYFRYMGYCLYEEKLLSYSFNDKDYNVKIVRNPFLIALSNAKNGNSDEELGLGCSEPYIALELKYKGTSYLSKEDEENLFERITFYLTKELKTSIYLTSRKNVNTIWDECYVDDEDNEDKPFDISIKVNDLISYSPLLKLYKQALATEDQEIRFLQFYKIMEYVSPIVAKLEAYEKLNKRLDVLATTQRDSKYLESLFSITRKYDTDVKDDNIAFSVIQSCVDVIPLWECIPDRLRKQIRCSLHLSSDYLSDDVKEEQLVSLQRQIAKILYSTRNNIVHAKSNYTPNGLELEGEEFIEGNCIMDKISMSIIQWNERLSDLYRIR